jgi:hypothetical protein
VAANPAIGLVERSAEKQYRKERFKEMTRTIKITQKHYYSYSRLREMTLSFMGSSSYRSAQSPATTRGFVGRYKRAFERPVRG